MSSTPEPKPTLRQLVQVRSRFRESLDRYLDQVGTLQAEAHNFLPRHVDPGTIRQQVLVHPERIRFDDVEARRREAERRDAYLDDEDRDARLERAYARRGPDRGDDDEAERESKVKVVDWEDLRRTLRRGVILGDPGFGKSFLLGHEAQRVAVACDRVAPASLPILLRLTDVALRLEEAKGDPAAAIAAAVTERYHLDESFAQWLASRILAPGTVLLLDALDEVPAGLRARLRTALAKLSDQAQGTLLITSRLVGYGGAPFPLDPAQGSREVELAGFNPRQVDAFISAWFTGKPESGRRLQEYLRKQPALRSLARTPLLLAFLCLVADEPQPIPTNRSGLLERVLRLLLRGVWREESQREQTPTRITRKLQMLQRVAWHFATYQSRWRDYMPDDELDELLESDANAAYLWQTAPTRPTGAGGDYRGLLAELSERDGVFVAAGAGAPGEAVPYLWLHRTLPEYLTAKYLAAQPSEVWQAHVTRIGVFDADWIEPLILLGGCVADPNMLVQTILCGEGDPFHQRHLLAAQIIGEAGDRCKEQALFTTVSTRLAQVLQSGINGESRRAAYALAAMRDHGRSVLHAGLTSPDSWVRTAAVRGLTQLGHAELTDLQTALRDADPSVRIAAVHALLQLGNDALPCLRVALQDEDREVKVEVVNGLVWLGDVALPDLRAALLDQDAGVRTAAIKSLSRLGAAALPELQASLQDEESDVRDVALAELRRLGDVPQPDLSHELQVKVQRLEAVETMELPQLRLALHHDRLDVRIVAASRLVSMGSQGLPALEEALHATRHAGAFRDDLTPRIVQDTMLRWHVVTELGGVGITAIPVLCSVMADRMSEPSVRQFAANAIAGIGEGALPTLTSLLRHNDASVRASAVSALGKLGEIALPGMRIALADATHYVVLAALLALNRLVADTNPWSLTALLRDVWPGVHRYEYRYYYPLLLRLVWRLKCAEALQPMAHQATEATLGSTPKVGLIKSMITEIHRRFRLRRIWRAVDLGQGISGMT